MPIFVKNVILCENICAVTFYFIFGLLHEPERMKPLISFLLFPFAFLLTLTSCHKQKDGNFTLQLKAKYGDQSFAIHTPNTDPAGRKIQVENLKFYLSHVTLIKTDNSETELKDVLFCDFSNPTTLPFNCANVTGDIKAIRLSCGVDSVQNLTDPDAVTSSNPLSGYNGMYWSWLKYQFEVLEAKADTTTTGTGTFNWHPVYHIGGNALYRTTTISKSFSVCCDTKYTLNVALDVKKIFFGTQTLDIITEPSTQCAASDNPVIAPKFVDNFSQAFSTE